MTIINDFAEISDLQYHLTTICCTLNNHASEEEGKRKEEGWEEKTQAYKRGKDPG